MSEGMHTNEGYPVDLLPLYPSGKNSTFFTACCETAITRSECCCPRCGREVIGHDIENEHERYLYRWRMTYRG